MTRKVAVSAYRRRHFEKVGPLSDVVAYARTSDRVVGEDARLAAAGGSPRSVT
ncbi:hypothetical protein [Kribbella sp. CA-294648]|uniref:hypothetical protein n=1 Tax=Kribbella sp. CA-294648 TaxID=3239948 RepID=UPI003D8D38E8